MYLKSNNIIITSNMNELPLNEVKKSQHIVLLEKANVGFFSNIEVDVSTSMVCCEIQDNLLYVMECNRSYVVGAYDEDDPSLDQKHFHRTYLSLNGELYNLGDRDRWEYGYNIEDLEAGDKQIHQNVFKGFTWFSQINSGQAKISYLPVKLDDDSYLVFTISSSFFNFTKWDISNSAFIVNKNSDEVIVLKTDFIALYNVIKKIKKDFLNTEDFKKFDDIIKLTYYDIQKHLSSSETDQELMLYELMKVAHPEINRNQLKELFSFFYHNDDLNIKIAISSVKEYHSKYILYKDGQHVSSYNYDEAMKIEILKAQAIYIWDNGNRKTGIDPKTGEYYESGVKSQKPVDYYEDAGGIFYSANSYKASCYIKYGDIFVQVDNNHPEAKELKERKALVTRLATS